jgi:hypothetical protein
MTLISESIWPQVAQVIGFDADTNLLAMHFAEIEMETENVFELLTVLRNNAYHGDQLEAQETAAELTIVLEHLHHHVSELLPRLQEKLEIEP